MEQVDFTGVNTDMAPKIDGISVRAPPSTYLATTEAGQSRDPKVSGSLTWHGDHVARD